MYVALVQDSSHAEKGGVLSEWFSEFHHACFAREILRHVKRNDNVDRAEMYLCVLPRNVVLLRLVL
mgnify:CR=1 FL=1